MIKKINTKLGTIKFEDFNSRIPSNRINSFFTKEPDTLTWIENMDPGETLFDIGANVGTYSIYAAKKGLRVYSFEPESNNFLALNHNILINNLLITAYPIAVGTKKPRFGKIRLSKFEPGSSIHTIDKNHQYKNIPQPCIFEQGVFEMRLVDICSFLNLIPNHVKIDVDSIDGDIILYSKEILPNISSILIEIDSEDPIHIEANNYLLSIGFSVDSNQIQRSMRIGGPNNGVGNRIYYNRGKLI